MTLLEIIRQFLELLATRFYLTARYSGPFYGLILVCLIIIRFLFQRKRLLKIKFRHILKRCLQNRVLYMGNEKRKPNFKILKSVFMDGMSHRYREWGNPVAYFCTETSRTEDKAVEDGNSDEGSSHDENDDNAEKGSKMGETETDSTTCISSTKAVFESLPASQIAQKRKAESNKSVTTKRSKSTNSPLIGEDSKPSQAVTAVNIKTSSETSSGCRERENSISDHRSTPVHDVACKSDRTDVNEHSKIAKETLPIEKSKTSGFPSQVSPLLKDEKPGIEDFSLSNTKDKSGESAGRNTFYSLDIGTTLKNTVLISQAKCTTTKATQTETTEKSYPVPQKIRKNVGQDKSCNIPTDPRIRKNASRRESSFGSSKNIKINANIRINQETTSTCQNISNSNTEFINAQNYEKSATDCSQNLIECPPIFPKINFSAILREQPEHLASFGSLSFDINEKVPEVVRQFFENVKTENIKALKTTKSISLGSLEFTNKSEEKLEDKILKSTSVEDPEGASDILPCSSTYESQASVENVKGESSEDPAKVKTYPGLSLQPLKVKKDARYQKKFYKEKKEITLPKKLGEVIQWAAKKPRDEVTIPASDVLFSDERNLPIHEYHERAQKLTQSFMTMFDSVKELKAKHKLDKKSREEQKEKMRRENTGYIESSFKEESPSSESSSDSLPTSGDSPIKARTSPVMHPKICSDYDLSMVKVSPLKPLAKVSPRLSIRPEWLREAPPGMLKIRHLSDDENVCEELSGDSDILREFSTLSVLIRFVDMKEIVNPKKAIFCRDSFDTPRIKSFFKIENVAPVSCSPISVEQFLYNLRKMQAIYYEALYTEDDMVFEDYRDDMIICVIPLRRPQSPDGDYELQGDTLVKMERRIEFVSEHNYSPFTRDLDYILDEDMPEAKLFESPKKSKRTQKLPVISQASNMHHLNEVFADDFSSDTTLNNWTLCEIELGENKVSRKHSGKHFPQNAPAQMAEIRIDSKMEEWPAVAFQAHATSSGIAEEKLPGPKSTDSSGNTMPVLFGYPPPELISRITDNTSKWQCTATSPIRRKTKSESSKYGSSNLITVERKKPGQEVQTTPDVFNEDKSKYCVSENLVAKQSESENHARRTDINVDEYSLIRKDLKSYFKSDPGTISSERHEPPCGVPTKEGTASKELSPSLSAKKTKSKSIQIQDIPCELRSTPEKTASVTNLLELSSDPENKDVEATGEQSRK